jgi:uncharacterized protein YbjT (DUF2867 family)
MPTRMSLLCWKIVITHPQVEIRQGDLADRHDLILAVIQFVHLTFLLRQILHGSQQLTLETANAEVGRRLVLAL